MPPSAIPARMAMREQVRHHEQLQIAFFAIPIELRPHAPNDVEPERGHGSAQHDITQVLFRRAQGAIDESQRRNGQHGKHGFQRDPAGQAAQADDARIRSGQHHLNEQSPRLHQDSTSTASSP